MNLPAIEVELARRIKAHRLSAESGSVMSRKKQGARAEALSDFLGWLRHSPEAAYDFNQEPKQ